jgi:hypothetical protein
MGIEFIKKRCNDYAAASNAEKVDVTFRINKGGIVSDTQRYSGVLGFTRETIDQITDTGFMVLGIDKKRGKLFFKSADSLNGFKVSAAPRCKKQFVKFTINDVLEWVKFIGEYSIEFDENEKLYCITAKKT